MEPKWIRAFVYSAGGVLLAAALGRFIIALGTAPVLDLPDPLLEIPLRYAVLGVGVLELVVALVCLFGKSLGRQAGLVAWLATNWAVYRIGVFWLGCYPQCTCLGRLTDPLHLPRGGTSHLLEYLPVYLLVGSYAALVWLMRHPPRRLVPGFFITCTACGGHIEFPASGLGQNITCPHCQTAVTLQQPV